MQQVRGNRGHRCSRLRRAPQRAQTRRAWRVLVVSFSCFAILIAGLGFGFATYRTNATKPRGGTVRQIITGSQAQVRSRQQSFWHDLSEGSTVNEGDTIRTGDDTRMRIALFDNTDRRALREHDGRIRSSCARRSISTRTPRSNCAQDHGRVVVTENSETEYNRVQVDVLTRGTTIEARQPGTSFRVLVLAGRAGRSGAGRCFRAQWRGCDRRRGPGSA